MTYGSCYIWEGSDLMNPHTEWDFCSKYNSARCLSSCDDRVPLSHDQDSFSASNIGTKQNLRFQQVTKSYSPSPLHFMDKICIFIYGCLSARCAQSKHAGPRRRLPLSGTTPAAANNCEREKQEEQWECVRLGAPACVSHSQREIWPRAMFQIWGSSRC